MMPYLVDINIFLELMLEQKEENIVKQLLNPYILEHVIEIEST